jgi:hypothetical protein
MFYDLLATAIETAGRNQLDDYSRQIWRAHGSGIIVDDQAQQLQEQIQRRRRPQPVAQSLLSATPVVPRYYIQRSPEQPIARQAGFDQATTPARGDRAVAAKPRGRLHHGRTRRAARAR